MKPLQRKYKTEDIVLKQPIQNPTKVIEKKNIRILNKNVPQKKDEKPISPVIEAIQENTT